MDDATQRYHDGSYAARHPDWHEAHAAWKARHVAGVLEAAGVTPARVCDIGCGTGGVLAALAEHLAGEPTLVGYDIAADAVGRAPSGRAERVELIVTDDVLDGRSFDVALVLDVLEHLEDPSALLATLRPKADLLVVHVPLDRTWLNDVRPGQYRRLRDAMGHLHAFTRASALALVDAAGYHVIADRYTQPAVEFAEGRGARALRPVRAAVGRAHPRLAARVLGGSSLWITARPRP